MDSRPALDSSSSSITLSKVTKKFFGFFQSEQNAVTEPTVAEPSLEEQVTETFAEMDSLVKHMNSNDLSSRLDKVTNDLKSAEDIEKRCLMEDFSTPGTYIVRESCKRQYTENKVFLQKAKEAADETEKSCNELLAAVKKSEAHLKNLKTLIIAKHNADLSTTNDENSKTLLRNNTEELLQKVIKKDQEVAESAVSLAEAYYTYKTGTGYDFYIVKMENPPVLDAKMNLKNHEQYNKYLPLIIKDNKNQYWIFGLNKINIHKLTRLKRSNSVLNKLNFPSEESGPKPVISSVGYAKLFDEISLFKSHLPPQQREANFVKKSAASASNAVSSYVYADTNQDRNPFEDVNASNESQKTVMLQEKQRADEIERNYQAAVNIAHSIAEINKLAIQTRALVLQQGETIESIAHHILTANEKVTKGTKNLDGAYQHFQRSNKAMNKIILGLGITVAALTVVGIAKKSMQ